MPTTWSIRDTDLNIVHRGEYRTARHCGSSSTLQPQCSIYCTSLAEIRTALGTWEPDYRHVENFALGADAIHGYPNSDQYWGDIRETLLQVMNKYPGFHKPKILIVTGDAVDEYFIRFLATTMYDFLGVELPILSSDATTVAAKGAAELMRRSKSCDDGSPPNIWPPGRCWS